MAALVLSVLLVRFRKSAPSLLDGGVGVGVLPVPRLTNGTQIRLAVNSKAVMTRTIIITDKFRCDKLFSSTIGMGDVPPVLS
jgi:hypothetical protein